MRRASTIAVVLFALPALAAEPTLGFFELKGNGLTPEEITTVSDLLQSEAVALGRYRVIARSDLAVLLGIERQKQLLGCSDEANNCMQELLGALDVDRLLVGDVARVEDTLVMNLSLLDVRRSTSISRGSRSVKGGLVDLLEELRPLLYEVVNSDAVNVSAPLEVERGFGGLVVGARADGEVLGLGIAPGISFEYSGKRLGVALVLLVKVLPGARLEGRFYPFTFAKGRVRTQLAAGVTAFPEGVALRAAAGGAVHFGPLQVFVDVGYERFVYLRDWQAFSPNALTVGLGVGFAFF